MLKQITKNKIFFVSLAFLTTLTTISLTGMPAKRRKIQHSTIPAEDRGIFGPLSGLMFTGDGFLEANIFWWFKVDECATNMRLVCRCFNQAFIRDTFQEKRHFPITIKRSYIPKSDSQKFVGTSDFLKKYKNFITFLKKTNLYISINIENNRNAALLLFPYIWNETHYDLVDMGKIYHFDDPKTKLEAAERIFSLKNFKDKLREINLLDFENIYHIELIVKNIVKFKNLREIFIPHITTYHGNGEFAKKHLLTLEKDTQKNATIDVDSFETEDINYFNKLASSLNKTSIELVDAIASEEKGINILKLAQLKNVNHFALTYYSETFNKESKEMIRQLNECCEKTRNLWLTLGNKNALSRFANYLMWRNQNNLDVCNFPITLELEISPENLEEQIEYLKQILELVKHIEIKLTVLPAENPDEEIVEKIDDKLPDYYNNIEFMNY